MTTSVQNLPAAGAFRGRLYEVPINLNRIGSNYANDCPRNFDPLRQTAVREIINEQTRRGNFQYRNQRSAAFISMPSDAVDLNKSFNLRKEFATSLPAAGLRNSATNVVYRGQFKECSHFGQFSNLALQVTDAARGQNAVRFFEFRYET